MRPIANQKKITVHKEKVEKESGKKRPYMIAYVDTIEQASQKLKNSAFKVYIYILTNQTEFYFGLSPQDISNRYGISIDAVRDGIKQLLKEGYLVPVEGSNNEFEFYDRLDKKPIALPEEVQKKLEKRVFINRETGKEEEYTYQQILNIVEDEEYAKKIWEGNV